MSSKLLTYPLDLLRKKQIRYLVTGGVNTVFGYAFGVAAYYLLSPRLHIVVIGAISSVVSITFSFVTYKIFVFKTKGNFLSEYIRCYYVYGFTSVLGIASLWFFVDVLHFSFWIIQALLIGIVVVVSYIGHNNFTFKKH